MNKLNLKDGKYTVKKSVFTALKLITVSLLIGYVVHDIYSFSTKIKDNYQTILWVIDYPEAATSAKQKHDKLIWEANDEFISPLPETKKVTDLE